MHRTGRAQARPVPAPAPAADEQSTLVLADQPDHPPQEAAPRRSRDAAGCARASPRREPRPPTRARPPRRRHHTVTSPSHRTLLTTSHRSKNHLELQQRTQITNEPAIAPGTGKTHLAIGLAVRACQTGHRVALATAAEWVDKLAAAHESGRLSAELTRLGRYPRILVDEVGYIPFEAEAANLFFQLISNRYERASVIVTSNKPFGRWGGGLRRRDRGHRHDRPPGRCRAFVIGLLLLFGWRGSRTGPWTRHRSPARGACNTHRALAGTRRRVPHCPFGRAAMPQGDGGGSIRRSASEGRPSCVSLGTRRFGPPGECSSGRGTRPRRFLCN
ncbi:ATP-binding protein [Streptomyces mirabilis]|uniref:ATP-binding protein n=1 Tax=Streptomyces mirabilis TaxID=68239 RepID=UPI0036C7031F